MNKLIEDLKKLIEALKDFIERMTADTPPDIFQIVPPHVFLNGMARAIEKFEDYVQPGGRYRDHRLAPAGSLTWRCKNPGACRFYTGGYLSKYGVVKEYTEGLTLKPGQRGFAQFSAYELGAMYLKNLILEKAKRHPEWTLVEFFADPVEGWAPASDNNEPKKYAKFVAGLMGVGLETWKLKQLL